MVNQLPDKPRRTRISAYAVIVRDMRMLLVRCSSDSDAPGQWTLPGGGIEFGEDPSHAAVREVREETGLDVALDTLLKIDSRHIHNDAADHHAIRIIYSAHIIGGTLAVEVGGSTDACEWISLDRAVELPLVELAKIGIALGGQLSERV